MSCRRNEIERRQTVKTLHNNKRLTNQRNQTSNKTNNEQLTEEESNKINIYSFFKTQYNALLKSNFPTYSCIIFYITICLVGNVFTGVIVFKHLGLQSPSWKSLFQTQLTSDEKLTGPEVDYDIEYVERDELDFVNLNKTENRVSQFGNFHFYSSNI